MFQGLVSCLVQVALIGIISTITIVLTKNYKIGTGVFLGLIALILLTSPAKLDKDIYNISGNLITQISEINSNSDLD